MPRHQHAPPDAAPRRTWKQSASLGLALLTCPCHLPLLLGALAGTALGAWMRQYALAVFLAMLGICVWALRYGCSALDRRHGVAEPPAPRARGDDRPWAGR
jgi:mercuric ion transport protein